MPTDPRSSRTETPDTSSRHLAHASPARHASVALLVLIASQAVACGGDGPDAPDSTEITKTSSPLVGGTVVSTELYPEAVFWFAGTTAGGCTGVFLTDRHLLTAKHCLQPAVDSLVSFTRSPDFDSPAAVWELARVKAISFDNGDSRFYRAWEASSLNDIMLIEFHGRPSRDWHRLSMPTSGTLADSTNVIATGTFEGVGYGCITVAAGKRSYYRVPSTGDVGMGRNANVKTGVMNPPFWQDSYVTSDSLPLPVTFKTGAVQTLRPVGTSLCGGDSGGPLFKDGKLVAIASGFFYNTTWGMPWSGMKGSMWQKLPQGGTPLNLYPLVNYLPPATVTASYSLDSLRATGSSLDPNEDVYFDNPVNPTNTPTRMQGPIGKTDAAGSFTGTFSTVGWPKGVWKFRLFTRTGGLADGYKTSNVVSVSIY